MRIGFRTWRLREENGKFDFEAMSRQDFTWALKGANKAEKPDPYKNSIGFYHYYDPEMVLKEYSGGRGMIGACMCWGRMAGKEVKERMFRAEYSWILAVTMPSWEQFARPSAPALPPSLSSRLWMAALTKERARLLDTEESFQRYVEALALVLGIDSANLNLKRIHTNFQANRKAVEAQMAKHDALVAEWTRFVETWPAGQSARFKAQMPFPVFDSVSELVAYAKEFGDLGPPDRSAPKARPNWWEGLGTAVP